MEQAGWSFGLWRLLCGVKEMLLSAHSQSPIFQCIFSKTQGESLELWIPWKLWMGSVFFLSFSPRSRLWNFFSALNTPGNLSTNDSLNTYKESSHLEFGTFLCWQLSVSMKYWLQRKEIPSPHVAFCKLNWSFATSTTGYVFTMGKYYPDIILPEQQFLNK